jgi:hypothetical protein
LAAGPTPVFYVRQLAPAGSAGGTSSNCPGTPTGRDRLGYVAVLTGRTLQPTTFRQVRRSAATDRAALVADVRREREREHAEYVRDLVASGHVTRDEADALTVQVDVRLHER